VAQRHSECCLPPTTQGSLSLTLSQAALSLTLSQAALSQAAPSQAAPTQPPPSQMAMAYCCYSRCLQAPRVRWCAVVWQPGKRTSKHEITLKSSFDRMNPMGMKSRLIVIDNTRSTILTAHYFTSNKRLRKRLSLNYDDTHNTI
jgi:hypothetical protein